MTLRSGDFFTIPRDVPHGIKSGPDGARALNISSPAGFAELIARAGTPLHLATPETELDAELLMAVTEELGDVVLGPPGMTPADLDRLDQWPRKATFARADLLAAEPDATFGRGRWWALFGRSTFERRPSFAFQCALPSSRRGSHPPVLISASVILAKHLRHCVQAFVPVPSHRSPARSRSRLS